MMAFIWFVIGIAWIAIGIAEGRGGTIATGFFGMIMAIICGLSGIFMKKSLIDEIDHGRFHEAKNGCVIWLIIGIAAFALPTILLIMVYMKLEDALHPQAQQYAPYPAGQAAAQQSYPQQQPPQQVPPSQQPAQQPPAQHPHPSQQKYEMMKCKNCGVQFPAFMANCPNCGSPKG